jgi:hypothetical protein
LRLARGEVDDLPAVLSPPARMHVDHVRHESEVFRVVNFGSGCNHHSMGAGRAEEFATGFTAIRKRAGRMQQSNQRRSSGEE